MTQTRTAPRHVFALIPMKPFGQAKSRLRDSVPHAAREALALAMFERVVYAASSCSVVQAVCVLTPGVDVALHARRVGAHVLNDVDVDPPSLAAQIDAALPQLAALGADAALVLMADLPYVASGDIAQLVAALARVDVAMAADARGASTNALALRLPAPMLTAFGDPSSFALHARRARALELTTIELSNPRLAHDVDVSEDLPEDATWATEGREFFTKLPH